MSLRIEKYTDINPINPEYQRNPNTGNSLNKIAKSMTENGILSLPVCVVYQPDGKKPIYYLVDGLHRVEAARIAGVLDDLQILVSTKICKTNLEVVEIMKQLNTTQTRWRVETYVNFYANCGEGNYQHYQKLVELDKTYRLGMVRITNLINGLARGSNQNVLKQGRLVIKDLDFALKAINFYQKFVAECVPGFNYETMCDAAQAVHVYAEYADKYVSKDMWNQLKQGKPAWKRLYAILHKPTSK